MPTVLVTGPWVRRTRRLFLSIGRNHHQYTLHLLTEGWPGWVGLGGFVKYQDGIPANGSQYELARLLWCVRNGKIRKINIVAYILLKKNVFVFMVSIATACR